jgi:serine/threonine protein phosphatase Stp1
MSLDRFRSSAATRVSAARSHNEDAYVNRPEIGLWAVADGAGGHARGDMASGMIAEALDAIPPGLSAGAILAEVRNRMSATHAALHAATRSRAVHDLSASTVVIMIARDDYFACLWAGDSRGYLLRDGRLTQITHDHSLVQELVDAGAISASEAERHPRANVITRAVGSDAEVLELDKVSGRLMKGDRFLLCSDGLCKTLDDRTLAELLAGPTEMPPADALVESALAHNARDNVTVVTVEVLAGT